MINFSSPKVYLLGGRHKQELCQRELNAKSVPPTCRGHAVQVVLSVGASVLAVSASSLVAYWDSGLVTLW